MLVVGSKKGPGVLGLEGVVAPGLRFVLGLCALVVGMKPEPPASWNLNREELAGGPLMRRWTYLICGALVLGSVATVAAGDTPSPYAQCAAKPTEADQKAAKSLFTAGQVSFNEADYKTAIQYWRDSYKRDCTAHLLLLNLARAFELNGDKREAVSALKTYLDRQPNAPDKPQIQRRIENLEAQLGGPVPQGASDAGAGTPMAGDAGVGPLPTGTSVEPIPTGTAGQVPGVPTARPYKSYPWIMVGAGAVLAIIGGSVWMSGNSKYKDAEAKCPTHTNCDPDVPDQADTGKSQMWIGGPVFITGAVALAGGLVWQMAFNKPKPVGTASLPVVAPLVGHGVSGLSLQGQF